MTTWLSRWALLLVTTLGLFAWAAAAETPPPEISDYLRSLRRVCSERMMAGDWRLEAVELDDEAGREYLLVQQAPRAVDGYRAVIFTARDGKYTETGRFTSQYPYSVKESKHKDLRDISFLWEESWGGNARRLFEVTLRFNGSYYIPAYRLLAEASVNPPKDFLRYLGIEGDGDGYLLNLRAVDFDDDGVAEVVLHMGDCADDGLPTFAVFQELRPSETDGAAAGEAGAVSPVDYRIIGRFKGGRFLRLLDERRGGYRDFMVGEELYRFDGESYRLHQGGQPGEE